MQDSRDANFDALAAELGHAFDGEIKIGGNYVSVVRHGAHAYVSGQLPRVGNTVIAVGRVGAGPAGTHTRTSVGVFQLPKNAAVEMDLIVAVD